MSPPWNLTQGGRFFCATPDCVANCPQPVDKPVDNFIEIKREGSTLGTYTYLTLMSNNNPTLNP